MELLLPPIGCGGIRSSTCLADLKKGCSPSPPASLLSSHFDTETSRAADIPPGYPSSTLTVHSPSCFFLGMWATIHWPPVAVVPSGTTSIYVTPWARSPHRATSTLGQVKTHIQQVPEFSRWSLQGRGMSAGKMLGDLAGERAATPLEATILALWSPLFASIWWLWSRKSTFKNALGIPFSRIPQTFSMTFKSFASSHHHAFELATISHLDWFGFIAYSTVSVSTPPLIFFIWSTRNTFKPHWPLLETIRVHALNLYFEEMYRIHRPLHLRLKK